MADESKKDSQSVDDIVDDLAADMGVEDQKVPDDSSDDAVASLGGVFDVPSSKKRRKKKPAAEEKAEKKSVETEEAASEEPAEEEKAAKKKSEAKKSSKKKSSTAGVPGVFSTGAGGDDEDLDFSSGSDYLDEDDLGGHKQGASSATMILSVVVVVLLVALGVVVVKFTNLGGDLEALARGELREKKNAEVAQQEAEWEAKQLALMEKYGTLNVTGSPLHALVKLNGQVQYGQTSSGAWRELRLTSVGGQMFRNLKIKNKHTIEVSAPGFTSDTVELTEGMWEGGSSKDPYGYTKQVALNLMPESGQRQLEFEQRMDTSNTDGDYYGTVSITSMPAGANITFNNHPLLDKKGEPLVTPVTFSEFYVKDEKSGKLEKKEVNVDTPPDVGHKIELSMPKEAGEYPSYVAALQRRMWTCEWKDGKTPDTPPAGKTFRDFCEYKFSLEMDFEGLKTYIERREAEKERVKAENQKLQAAMAEGEEGAASAE